MNRPIEWQIATLTELKQETPKVKSFTLKLPAWMQHRAGQHYDLRLTAQDGYQVQHSYSIASEPERAGEVDITVDRIGDGEVSPYSHDVLVAGDMVEMRGPIGGYFVWDSTLREPVVLIGGGSGVVPLRSILRHRAASHSTVPMRLLYSSRPRAAVIYYDELEKLNAQKNGLGIFHTLTRGAPPDWKGYTRRVDNEMIGEVIKPFGKSAGFHLRADTLRPSRREWSDADRNSRETSQDRTLWTVRKLISRMRNGKTESPG